MSETDRQTIGMAIYIRRTDRGLTQAQLARRIGTTPIVVTNWEIGKRAPRADMLLKLSFALDCSIDLLFGELRVREVRF